MDEKPLDFFLLCLMHLDFIRYTLENLKIIEEKNYCLVHWWLSLRYENNIFLHFFMLSLNKTNKRYLCTDYIKICCCVTY